MSAALWVVKKTTSYLVLWHAFQSQSGTSSRLGAAQKSVKACKHCETHAALGSLIGLEVRNGAS